MTNARLIASLCFILSGAASISYQMVWLRAAMSHFGVITPVISVLLSVFMLGLALGTQIAGRLAPRLSAGAALGAYALVELGIAGLALAVPRIFDAGYAKLLAYDSVESGIYMSASALTITLALLPPCLLIGATLPLMMRVLQQTGKEKNFGLLYLANLTGALLGCALPLFWIEWRGLASTLHATAVANLAAALLAAYACVTMRAIPAIETPETGQGARITASAKAFLFLTGFAAIGSELLWVKAFTPITGSSVYAFAIVLALYLVASILGNAAYMRNSAHTGLALRLLPFAGLLVIFAAAGRLVTYSWPPAGILPVSFLLGYLTPYVIDTASNGHPRAAARAYALNFAGCILGPLVTGYMLFPLLGLKLSLFVHVLLLLLAACMLARPRLRTMRKRAALLAACSAMALILPTREDALQRDGVLYRDWLGYVAATGEYEGKRLWVNGIAMTSMTTITKQMMHLPAALHPQSKKALIICMGMGTTLRSATTWPIDAVTVVELSPAVTRTFPYFHADAQNIIADPRVRVVVDDGRRYLLRTNERYDIISIDPPPPLDASGSGLLYSADFMAVVASHLHEGGVVAQWVPRIVNHSITQAAIAAMAQHFPYIRLYQGMDGWGTHIIASAQPLPELSVEDYIRILPEKAKTDLLEFHRATPITEVVPRLLKEVPIPPKLPAPITDDRLHNEFNRLGAKGWLPKKH